MMPVTASSQSHPGQAHESLSLAAGLAQPGQPGAPSQAAPAGPLPGGRPAGRACPRGRAEAPGPPGRPVPAGDGQPGACAAQGLSGPGDSLLRRRQQALQTETPSLPALLPGPSQGPGPVGLAVAFCSQLGM
eukprot:2843542-Rhodomonas_salina.1